MPNQRAPYSGELFNTQTLLFDQTHPVIEVDTEFDPVSVPDGYYKRGWAVIDDVPDALAAVEVQEGLIKSVHPNMVPLQGRFRDRIQLAKADEIPVCDDVLASSYQVLHFDMGHPFVQSPDQLFVSHVGLYRSQESTRDLTAKTRIVQLEGLMQHLTLRSGEVDERIETYTRDHGDGWADHNSYRLACFARVLDALSDEPQLADQTDKTVSQWFHNEDKTDGDSAYENEADFYRQHGVDLDVVEHRVALEPGQLLVLDNTRVIHGRIGHRAAKEVFNFMFGIETLSEDRQDITALRYSIGRLLLSETRRR